MAPKAAYVAEPPLPSSVGGVPASGTAGAVAGAASVARAIVTVTVGAPPGGACVAEGWSGGTGEPALDVGCALLEVEPAVGAGG